MLKLVVSGTAGSGKSTLVDLIAHALQLAGVQYRFGDPRTAAANHERQADIGLARDSLRARTAGFGNEIVILECQAPLAQHQEGPVKLHLAQCFREHSVTAAEIKFSREMSAENNTQPLWMELRLRVPYDSATAAAFVAKGRPNV